MPPSDFVPDHPAFLRRLCRARWWWLAAVLLASIATPALLGVTLPQWPLLGIIAVHAALNFATQRRLQKYPHSNVNEIFLQLCTDLVAISALLFFSGGATNPLIFLLLPIVAVAALSLKPLQLAALCLLAVASYSGLMQAFIPLALADAARATRLHLIGMWLTFAFSAVLIALLVWRMTAQIIERDAALAAAREQALREERVLALGALAAGAAHELGTPLATMAVLAGELSHEKSLSAEGQEDLATLRQQIAACKDILTRLSARAGAPRAASLESADLGNWLASIREQWQTLLPGAQCELRLPPGQPPVIQPDPTLDQALLNLLNNAARAADQKIALIAEWSENHWAIEIRDDGPGYSDAVLAQAGHEAFPAHAEGSGIGIMLSLAAVERLGGRLRLYNPDEGGAAARIEFPRHD